MTTSNSPSGVRQVEQIPVRKISPEDGLGRRRDRAGHEELQRSIAQFGVLTPITVRLAPDGSGDYLLIKGQGRTLACQILGIETIPAIVVSEDYAEHEKVRQFLVENVARLKMRPIDRALLMQRARQSGEETAAIAVRFGVTATTVRRLLAQLEGAGSQEVAALRSGEVNMAVHAVLARHVDQDDRPVVLTHLRETRISAADLQMLFKALGWERLMALGPRKRDTRLGLLIWALSALGESSKRSSRERIVDVGGQLPHTISIAVPAAAAVAAGQ